MRRPMTVSSSLSAIALALTILVAVLAGTARLQAGQPEEAQAGEPAAAAVPDTAIGLVEGSVFEAAAPPPVQVNDSEPGERPTLVPSHPEAPPPIPHGIADFLPITRKDNACVDCHWLDEKEEGLPTPIPESHFVDYRNAPGAVRETIAGARWVCVSCHVPQSDNPPLVGNDLSPAPESGE